MNKNLLDEPRHSPADTIDDTERVKRSFVPPTRPAKSTLRKIWIDIDNSPHVPLFLPIIEELEKRGYELLLTARDMYQVCELLDFFQLRSRVKVVGSHTGGNRLMKVLVNCARAVELLPIAAKHRPDLGISHGSRAQVLVCKSLGIPSVLMHDYEHSTKTGFLEATWTLTPALIPVDAMSKHPERTLKYPGLKEDIYIPRFHPDPSILPQLGIQPSELLITLRPPATEAHYHNPESEILFAATLKKIARQQNIRAVTLPRNARQGAQLREQCADLIRTGHMIIPEHPLDGLNLIWFSDLVVSGGGTMNREAAALNVPVYSLFRGKIGAVDRALAREGRLVLLESVQDVEDKLRLEPREKSLTMKASRPEVLESVIQAIIKIGEAK
jgi:uncharacterized protein